MVYSNKYFLYIVMSFYIMIFIGCSGEGVNNDIYVVEKMFYKAEKIKQNILTNPDIANPEEYEKAELAYREIIDKLDKTEKLSKELKGILQRSWLTIAQLQLFQKKDDEALKVYNEIIQRSMNDRELCAVAQFSIAQSLERLKKFDEAIEAYKVVFRNYPPVLSDTLLPNYSILQTPIYIARLYRANNKAIEADRQYEEARNYYEQVIQRYPQSEIAVEAQNQIAITYGDQGKWNQAILILNDIIRRYPDEPKLNGVMFALGMIYDQQLNQSDKAFETFQRILNRNPKNETFLGQVYLAIGNIYLKQKRYNEARTQFKNVLENYQNDQNSCINAQLAVAKSYEDQGNWGKAMNEYQWIVENYPTTIHALNVPLYIADHYWKRNEQNLARNAYESAIEHYKRVVEQYPNTPLTAIAQDYTASGYIRLEKWEEAANALRLLTKMDIPLQNKVKSYLTLENLYEEKLNDPVKALEIYSELLQQYPQFPLAANIKSKSHELQQRVDSYKRNNQPPRPSNIVTAKVLSPTAVEISWQQNKESDFSHYKLVRSESPRVDQSGVTIAEINSRDQAAFLDENLKQGNTYYYRLYTFDRGGLNAASKEVAVKMEAKQIMATINLQARSNDWFVVSLSWNPYDERDFDSYKIYRTTSPGVSTSYRLIKSIFDPTKTQFEDTDVKDNTTYYYKVYVYNKDGAKKPSNEVKILTSKNTPPKQVTLSKPLNIDNETVELSWSTSNDLDFSMYRIYRSQKSPVLMTSSPIWMNSNKELNRYKDTGLKSGKTYYYKVVVYDKGGLFAESNEISISR